MKSKKVSKSGASMEKAWVLGTNWNRHLTDYGVRVYGNAWTETYRVSGDRRLGTEASQMETCRLGHKPTEYFPELG